MSNLSHVKILLDAYMDPTPYLKDDVTWLGLHQFKKTQLGKIKGIFSEHIMFAKCYRHDYCRDIYRYVLPLSTITDNHIIVFDQELLNGIIPAMLTLCWDCIRELLTSRNQNLTLHNILNNLAPMSYTINNEDFQPEETFYDIRYGAIRKKSDKDAQECSEPGTPQSLSLSIIEHHSIEMFTSSSSE